MALGAILIALLLAATAYEIWRQRSVAIDTAESRMSSLALALAEQTERIIRNVELVMDASAESISGSDTVIESKAVHQELIERAVGVPQIQGVAVTDAKGNIVNTLTKWPAPPVNLADRAYFQAHREKLDSNLFIGMPVTSRLHDTQVITLSKRLSGPDGKFKGIIVATLDPQFLDEAFIRVLPPHNSALALFRNDGILLSRIPSAPGAKFGKSYGHLPDFQAGSPPSGVARGASPMDGRIRIVSYQTLASYPLRVNLSLDQEDLLRSWSDNATRLAFFGVMAVMVVTAGIFGLARKLKAEEEGVRQLKESERRLRLSQFTLDNAADMVFWSDVAGTIIYGNRAACDRTGCPIEDLLGLNFTDILITRAWNTEIEAVRRNGAARFESRHKPRSGEAFPVDVVMTIVTWEGQEYFCATARDISDQKKSEAALAEKSRNLEASNAELEQFAYVASHDLREPLRMVNSFVTMLAKRYGDKLDQEAQDYIAFAQDGATRMDRLILDLLEYSRVGRLDRPLAPVALGGAVELARKSLLHAIDESHAIIDIAPDLPVVMANEEELVRLLVNLLANAIKYRDADRDPHIAVTATVNGATVECRIADNGIGIQAEYYDRVFRIFQRLHARDRYEGTGIGLAICKKIVERHGGQIRVESVPGQGSAFIFTLKLGFTPSSTP